eukprot:349775_1
MNQNTEQRRNELLLQSRNKLKRKCKALKISGEGSKSDMINRIIQIYGRNAINQPPTTNEQNTQSQNAIDLQRKLRLQRRLQYQAPTIIIKRKKKRESSINSKKQIDITTELKPKKKIKSKKKKIGRAH